MIQVGQAPVTFIPFWHVDPSAISGLHAYGQLRTIIATDCVLCPSAVVDTNDVGRSARILKRCSSLMSCKMEVYHDGIVSSSTISVSLSITGY